MTLIAWLDILANDDRDWLVQVVVVLMLLGLSLFSWLAQKMKEKAAPPPAEDEGEGEAEDDWVYVESDQPVPPRRQVPRSRSGSVEEVVQAMREAARRRSAQRTGQDAGRPVVTPPVQTARAPAAAKAPEAIRQRHISPTAMGGAVDVEAARMAQRTRQAETRARKLTSKKLGRLQAESPLEQTAVETTGLAIRLEDRDEARRGIVLSEILGPPLSLRHDRAMWEL